MSDEKPWYHEGLKFKCTGCGGCCTGSPGYVFFTDEEAETMSAHLKISKDEFMKKYTRYFHGRYALKELSKTYDCIFLKDKKCTIYPVRPKQCRTFPWWVDQLKSKEAWEEAAARCEGINHCDAPIIPLEEIQKEL